MDLAGPKIRVGAVAGARHIATWKPVKDDIGRVTMPARVVVRSASAPQEEGEAPSLRLPDDAFAQVRRGDVLRFRDARGKQRSLVVREVGPSELVAQAIKRAYVRDRARAHLRRAGAKVGDVTLEVVGGEGGAVDIKVGDALVLTGRSVKGRPPLRSGDGSVVRPGMVACTLPEALERLEVGHRVLFDDGCIEAVVDARDKRGDSTLRVVRTRRRSGQRRCSTPSRVLASRRARRSPTPRRAWRPNASCSTRAPSSTRRSASFPGSFAGWRSTTTRRGACTGDSTCRRSRERPQCDAKTTRNAEHDLPPAHGRFTPYAASIALTISA
jgi:hypothetical protein